ncbi:serine/threonine-protein kinase [Chthoniobacter flavus]|uniref:serine/threonine-protein kinase n=1 Tax=Chthoniobacter flavus TaxID=191863 RepID=UPI00067956B1|nr:serine/threonine-protein kinase [Chthoniobacter flavus]
MQTASLEAPTVSAPPIRSRSEVRAYGHYVIAQHPDGSPWLLGRGGMGMTFKAMDMNLRCPVALKIISPSCFDGERSEHRFLREARLAAQIRHPNVAAIHHLDSQEGEFYYAMEYVDGISADAWVRRRGPMSVELALDIVMQIARALTAADRLKVVHRDIKPGNIMILPDPANGNRVIAKLIDFGLARSFAAEASPTATTCGFTGTPQFASPEQTENLELDVRSDIYSLGSTLWYFVVGEAPFVGTPARIIAQLLTSEPPWNRVKHLPKGVVRLLRTMLAKSPMNRPQTPVALHDQIEACREQLSRRGPRATAAKSGTLVPFEWYNLRSFALAGLLGVVLLWLALSPRAHLDEKAPQIIGRAEAAAVPSVPATVAQNVAKPGHAAAGALSKPSSEQGAPPVDFESVPDLSPVAVDLANFDHQSETSPIAQPEPDSAAAADLQSPESVALTVAGLESESQANTPVPAIKVPDQESRVSDRRRGTRQQRRSSSFSPWQSLDRVRSGVAGLVRQIF